MAVQTGRDVQREATRRLVIDQAMEALVGAGHGALTIAEVQRRVGLSRGAVLHHFPTRAALVEATVAEIVARNEAAAWRALETVSAAGDPAARAVGVLREVLSAPVFLAELELWAAARTDEELRTALRHAEGRAAVDLRRVVAEVFGPELVAHPRYPEVAELTVAVLRGLAVAEPLRERPARVEALLEEWARIVRDLLPLEAGFNW